ncbi:MAG: hypothetical protein RL385_5954, partial [Pseudomonadota bacterium]
WCARATNWRTIVTSQLFASSQLIDVSREPTTNKWQCAKTAPTKTRVFLCDGESNWHSLARQIACKKFCVRTVDRQSEEDWGAIVRPSFGAQARIRTLTLQEALSCALASSTTQLDVRYCLPAPALEGRFCSLDSPSLGLPVVGGASCRMIWPG